MSAVRVKALLLAGALAGGLPAGGCRAPAADRPGLRSVDAPPALHAVSSERLRQIMQRMDSLMFERMQTELELDRQRLRHVRALAEAAAELERTVDWIPGAVDDMGLSPEDRSRFLDLAGILRGEAGALRDRAEAGDLGALRHSLQRLESTCKACHGLYRGSGSR